MPEAKDERVWEREAERLERSRGRCTGVVAAGVGVGVVEVDKVDGAPTDEAKVAEEAEVNTDDDAVRELERVESVRGGDADVDDVDVDVVWNWDRLEELFTARPVQGACWSIFLSLRVDGRRAKTQKSSNSDKADRLSSFGPPLCSLVSFEPRPASTRMLCTAIGHRQVGIGSPCVMTHGTGGKEKVHKMPIAS